MTAEEFQPSFGILGLDGVLANVEIKHVDIDESMIRAIAQQAVAQILVKQPQAIQLRYL